MKIDVFNHFMPTAYLQRLAALIPGHVAVTAFPRLATLCNVDARLRLLEGFGDLQNVLSLANPPLELVAGPDVTPELARIANDALAEICARHCDHFPAFVAALPMNNIDAALAEIDRAIGTLGARGVQIFTHVAGQPLSRPEFRPIFRRMVEHDLPIWVHPMRGPDFADYKSEQASEDEIWFAFGWPYETTACMTRLIYSGLFDELPNLKIITHHYGGMIPFFSGKIKLGFRQIFFGTPERNPLAEERRLKRRPIEYFKMLYADTAVNGEGAATRCGHAFFGTGHSLFATDAPFDAEQGQGLIRDTIAAVEALEISPQERARIFAGNARELLKLPATGCSESEIDRMKTANIRMKLRDGEMGAYLAMPDRTPAGGIIAIMEIWGVNDTMRHHAHEFAQAGFVCLVPDLFWRQEPGVELSDGNPEHVSKAFDLYYDFDYDLAVRDMEDTWHYLAGRKECNGKVGAVGYCLGGKLCYLMCCRTDIDCAVAYYGTYIEHHIREAKDLHRPFLLHMAMKDRWVQAEVNDLLGAAAIAPPAGADPQISQC